MRTIISLSILLLLCALFLPTRAEAETGSLQVTCEPGARIYIDHQFFGVTNEVDNGLFIEDLMPGEHRLKAVMTGREPVVMQVEVIEGTAVEAVVDFLEPGGRAEEPGKPKEEARPTPKPSTNLGTFMLSSDPVGAMVFIDGEYKGDADIVVVNREAGTYTVVFRLGEKKLTGTYSLSAHEVLKLKANFIYNDIVNLSDQDRRRRSNKPITYPGR